ncbi:MAG: MFS transporter [Acidobacteria bacterium]|nr:MFS transporter [Acidobacteriota bacterium]
MSEQTELTPGWFSPASGVYRFLILLSVSLMLVGNYFAYDSIGALAPLIMDGMEIGREEIGMMYSFYSWPNLVMVLIGGFFIDRFGTRVMSLVFSVLIVLGAVLVAGAPTFWLMIAGRTIFGIGAESLIVCQSAILAKWFKGKELAFAFGLALTFMRLGTLFSFNTEAWIAETYNSWRMALWVAAGLCVLSLVCNVVYVFLERRAQGRTQLSVGTAGDKIVLSDIKRFGPSFWLITALCVTFYSAVFPFTAFSTDLFVDKWGYSVVTGGRITSILIFASMILSPILGGVVDKVGRRGTMMIFGALLLIPCHLMMGLTTFNPIVPMALLGFAFSLVPAALWPAVPLIVEEKSVGTAFGLITMVQNFGLAAFPWIVGSLRDVTQTYTAGMMVFASLGVAGLIFALLLKRADAKAGGSLERAGLAEPAQA